MPNLYINGREVGSRWAGAAGFHLIFGARQRLSASFQRRPTTYPARGLYRNKPPWFRNSNPRQHGVAHQVANSWPRPSKVCINQAFQQPISNRRGIRLGGRSRPEELRRTPRLQAQVNAFAPDHDETRTRRPGLRAAAKLHLCTQTSYHGTEAELWKLKSVQWEGRDTGCQA